MKPSILLAAIVLAGCAAPASTLETPNYDCPEAGVTTPFEHVGIQEASGIARSMRAPCVFWVHGDSGAPAVLYATDGAGRHVAEAWLDADAVDWEDIASFSLDGSPFILVADVGNNGASRDRVTLIAFPEPDLSAQSKPANVSVREIAIITIHYPGAPFDIEALAVDAESDEILFASKGETRLGWLADPSGPNQALYTVPLSRALRERSATLEFRTLIPGIRSGPGDPTREYLFGLGGGLATAMDIRPDRAEIAILTYREILAFPRDAGESWAQALAKTPRAIAVPDPGKDQMEGLAYSHDGGSLLVADERGEANSELTVVRARGDG